MVSILAPQAQGLRQPGQRQPHGAGAPGAQQPLLHQLFGVPRRRPPAVVRRDLPEQLREHVQAAGLRRLRGRAEIIAIAARQDSGCTSKACMYVVCMCI